MKKKLHWKTHAEIASNEIVVSKEDFCSNFDIVTAAKDDVNNEQLQLQFKCKNSIGDLHGIRDEYYQVKQNYGSNIPCIHFIILNDGEILLLPLFSPVYRVK